LSRTVSRLPLSVFRLVSSPGVLDEARRRASCTAVHIAIALLIASSRNVTLLEAVEAQTTRLSIGKPICNAFSFEQAALSQTMLLGA